MPSQRAFNTLSGIVFAFATIFHFLRSVLGWSVVIQGWPAPIGLSVALFLLAGFLAYTAFRLNR